MQNLRIKLPFLVSPPVSDSLRSGLMF